MIEKQLDLFSKDDTVILDTNLSNFRKNVEEFCVRYKQHRDPTHISFLEDRIRLNFFKEDLIEALKDFKI